MSRHLPTRFGLLIYDEVEVLDACGPFQVFTTAGRLACGEAGEPLLTVTTIAQGRKTVVARAGLQLVADASIDDAPDFDVLVVPGGVTAAAEGDLRLLSWIASRHKASKLTLGICTGSFLLAEAGVLDGRPATTHWEDEDEMTRRWPDVEVRPEPRWVDDGDLVTSAGISAGIDMSLYVVGRLYGEDLARRTARQMEYAWDEHA